MNRSLFAVPAMVCLAAALVTAQAPAERPNRTCRRAASGAATHDASSVNCSRRPSPSTSTMAANKVTYTGCVKPGTAADTWVLENAEVAQKAGASAPGTVGTSGTAKMTFNLDPAATVNLKAHANHKVEVVGMLSPAKAALTHVHARGRSGQLAGCSSAVQCRITEDGLGDLSVDVYLNSATSGRGCKPCPVPSTLGIEQLQLFARRGVQLGPVSSSSSR